MYVSGERVGKMRKDNSNNTAANRSEQCGLQSVAVSGATEKRNDDDDDDIDDGDTPSRSGLIAPQILTWLILSHPVYLSKVTSYTNEGFKMSPRC